MKHATFCQTFFYTTKKENSGIKPKSSQRRFPITINDLINVIQFPSNDPTFKNLSKEIIDNMDDSKAVFMTRPATSVTFNDFWIQNTNPGTNLFLFQGSRFTCNSCKFENIDGMCRT